MKSYVEFVDELKLPDETYQMVMYENARKLFKLPLPPYRKETPAGGAEAAPAAPQSGN
jgi:hypothetical protein